MRTIPIRVSPLPVSIGVHSRRLPSNAGPAGPVEEELVYSTNDEQDLFGHSRSIATAAADYNISQAQAEEQQEDEPGLRLDTIRNHHTPTRAVAPGEGIDIAASEQDFGGTSRLLDDEGVSIA